MRKILIDIRGYKIEADNRANRPDIIVHNKKPKKPNNRNWHNQRHWVNNNNTQENNKIHRLQEHPKKRVGTKKCSINTSCNGSNRHIQENSE